MARVVHAASYAFAAPANGLVLDLRLASAAWEEARLATAALSLVPPPARLRRFVDAWGNRVDRALFDRRVARLSVSMLIEAQTATAVRLPDVPPTPEDLAAEPGGPPPPPRPVGRPLSAADAATSAADAELAALTEGWQFVLPPAGQNAPLAILDRERRGLCLELSRLLVDRLRGRGIPARFVLGYALDAADRGRIRERHAWVAYRASDGWLEVDPVAPQRPRQARLATAWGPALPALQPVRARRPAGLVTERAEWSTQIDP